MADTIRYSNSDFYFSLKDPRCKHPESAVRAGQPAHLSVRCSRLFYCYHVVMTVRRENADGVSETRLPLSWEGMEDGADIYGVTFTEDKPGLLLFYFEVDIFGMHRSFGCDAGLCADMHSRRPFQLTVYEQSVLPDWFAGGVMYHIFVDRFCKSGAMSGKPGAVVHTRWRDAPHHLPDDKGEILNNDFFGGNLAGIVQKIPYLQSLGVTALYLSPIFEAFSNHKYDTGDYLKIDPMFGTEADFTRLIQAAADAGISVVLDGVFNHTGSDSVYFNQKGTYGRGGAARDPASPYTDWYTFKQYPDRYECWWDILTLPSVRKDCASFQQFIAGEGGVLDKWLSLGVRGFRLDVADELSASFVHAIRSRIEARREDGLLIGEVWEDASDKRAYGELKPYFWGKQLHSVMNYPLKDAIVRYVLSGDAAVLSRTANRLWQHYPQPVSHLLMNILGTHDTARILTVLTGAPLPFTRADMAAFTAPPKALAAARKRLKLAALLQYTLPGVPSLYYGDEAGMTGCKDPFNRGTFPWGRESKTLTAWYRRLGALRAAHPVFKDGAFAELYCDKGVYIFERRSESARAVIACNASDKSFTFAATGFTDALTGKKPRGKAVLPPGGVLVLTE